MNSTQLIMHDLGRDIDNILKVIHFIKESNQISDPKVKKLLEMSVSKEKQIISMLKTVSEQLERRNYE